MVVSPNVFSMKFTYLEGKDTEVKEVLGAVGKVRLEPLLHSRISQNLSNAKGGCGGSGGTVS